MSRGCFSRPRGRTLPRNDMPSRLQLPSIPGRSFISAYRRAILRGTIVWTEGGGGGGLSLLLDLDPSASPDMSICRRCCSPNKRIVF